MAKRPKLATAVQQMVFECFMFCHMMRTSNGFGPNGISLGQVDEYENRFGEVPVDDDILIRLIKECDEVALEHMRKKLERKDGE